MAQDESTGQSADAAPSARKSEPTGLIDFQAQRKASSRESLLAAGSATFCARGYFDVSVEDIAAVAGVSRMTFYRHFSGKAELAYELFRLSTEAARPHLLSIAQLDFRNRDVVRGWIAELFSSERERRQLLQVFIQASVSDDGFTARGHDFLTELVTALGATIPAFSANRESAKDRRQWVEGWMLIYEILDQGNHSARGSGVATLPETLDVLADRFTAYVKAFDC